MNSEWSRETRIRRLLTPSTRRKTVSGLKFLFRGLILHRRRDRGGGRGSGRRLEIIDRGVSDLLDKDRARGFGKPFREGFALVLEPFKADFHKVAFVEDPAEFRKKFRGGPRFAEFDRGLEELGAAFELPHRGFGS